MKDDETRPRAILLLFCGVLIGGLGVLVFINPEGESQESETFANFQGLNEILVRLDSSVNQLEKSLALNPKRDGPTAIRDSLSETTVRALNLQLASLEKVLSQGSHEVSDSHRSDRTPAAVRDSNVIELYPQNTQALIDLRDMSEVDATIRHLDWTIEQILKKFGSPTQVDDYNGIAIFGYFDFPGGGDVWVSFSNGRVVAFTKEFRD